MHAPPRPDPGGNGCPGAPWPWQFSRMPCPENFFLCPALPQSKKRLPRASLLETEKIAGKICKTLYIWSQMMCTFGSILPFASTLTFFYCNWRPFWIFKVYLECLIKDNMHINWVRPSFVDLNPCSRHLPLCLAAARWWWWCFTMLIVRENFTISNLGIVGNRASGEPSSIWSPWVPSTLSSSPLFTNTRLRMFAS